MIIKRKKNAYICQKGRMAFYVLKGQMALFACYRPYGLMKSKDQNGLNSCKAEMALSGRTTILVLKIIIIIIIKVLIIYVYLISLNVIIML